MANKYFKNFILCGEVDFHCLICVESFLDITDVDRHIRWEQHRKVLKDQVKSRKFKKEIIYKVDHIFYCEVCNYAAASMEMMNGHIATEGHKACKEKPKTDAEVHNPVFRRDCNYVVVKDTIVEQKDWNCITHLLNHCLVCGYQLQDESHLLPHIKSPGHVMNLISAKIVVDGDRYYRKFCGDDFMYCLTCKEAIPMTEFDIHWTSTDHLDFRVDCLFRTTYADSLKAIDKKKLEIEKLLIKKLANYFDVLEEKNTAICKQCQQVMSAVFLTMNDHKKIHDAEDDKHKDKNIKEKPKSLDSSTDEDSYEVTFSELTDHGQRRRELSKYGKANYIRLNSGGSKGYCSICVTTISGHLKLFKEHVKGARHRGHLELRGLKKMKPHKLPELPFKFIPEVLTNAYYSLNLKVLCLNKWICIDAFSFALVYVIDKRFLIDATKCILCNITYKHGYDVEHYGTEEHKKKLLNAKVLDKEGEFVRKVGDVFHCGTCNKIFPFWELMEKHLRSKPHSDLKKARLEAFKKQPVAHTVVKKTSKDPDIFYVQILSMGILKNEQQTNIENQMKQLADNGTIQLDQSL